jgi:hypothetical protein
VRLACAWPAQADDAELKKTVKGLVEKMQKAILKDDFETVIEMSHPKVVDNLGGKEKAINTTKTVMKQLKDKGVVINSMSTGEPTNPVRGDKEVYIVVPTKLEMTAPQGKVSGTGFILGISTDDGKTWKFVDGAPGPAEIRKLFPDIPKKLELPMPEFKVTKE